jgi:hypothetical protein
MQLEDPLVFNDIENKSPQLTQSIKEMQAKKHIFRPSIVTAPTLFGGHV